MQIGYGGGAIADYPWHYNGEEWSLEDERRAMECLSNLSELGVKYIDTAHRYGQGKSEQLIGRFLKGVADRERFTVITKIQMSDSATMIREFSESENHLGRADGILLHNPDLSRTDKVRSACRWLERLDVEWIGFSTEPSREARQFYVEFKLNMIQFPYSFWDRRAEDELLLWLVPLTYVRRVSNRVLGGPGEKRKMDIRRALRFIKGKTDIALVGTLNPEHLAECVGIIREG